jgi:hypothetical protein
MPTTSLLRNCTICALVLIIIMCPGAVVSCLHLQATAVPSNPATAGYKHACGAVTPSWKLVERHTRADVQQTWRDTGRGLQADSNAPQVSPLLCTHLCSAVAGQLVVRCVLPCNNMLPKLQAQLSPKLQMTAARQYMFYLARQ